MTLAGWLREPSPLDAVHARQAAVAELRPMLDFREDIAVLAPDSPYGRTSLLAAWAASSAVRFNTAVPVLLCACALVAVTLIVLFVLDKVALEWLVGWICLQTAIAAIWRRTFHRVIHGIDTPEHALGLLVDLFARLES